MDIDAAEFMNEPNMLEFSGAPKGYSAADYARDQDRFFAWVRKNYPRCLCVGPCSLGEGAQAGSFGAGIGSLMQIATTQELMRGAQGSAGRVQLPLL